MATEQNTPDYSDVDINTAPAQLERINAQIQALKDDCTREQLALRMACDAKVQELGDSARHIAGALKHFTSQLTGLVPRRAPVASGEGPKVQKSVREKFASASLESVFDAVAGGSDRTKTIVEATGLSKEDVGTALLILREDGRVRTAGARAGTTYHVA